MTDQTPEQEQEQDNELEMLEAIRAAFGDDALDELESIDALDSTEALQSTEGTANSDSLQQLVAEIDEKAIAGTNAEHVQQNKEQTESTRKYIVIRLGNSSFGIPMANVYEIQRPQRVTPLPGVPDWIQGVCNLRGNVLSVVDLRLLFGIDLDVPHTSSQRLVVTQSLVDDIDSGLIVDSVVGIRSYAESAIRPPTSSLDSQIESYLTGIVETNDQLITLLDIDKLLLSEHFRQFDAA